MSCRLSGRRAGLDARLGLELVPRTRDEGVELTEPLPRELFGERRRAASVSSPSWIRRCGSEHHPYEWDWSSGVRHRSRLQTGHDHLGSPSTPRHLPLVDNPSPGAGHDSSTPTPGGDAILPLARMTDYQERIFQLAADALVAHRQSTGRARPRCDVECCCEVPARQVDATAPRRGRSGAPRRGRTSPAARGT